MRKVFPLAVPTLALALFAVGCSKQLPTEIARSTPARSASATKALGDFCIGDFVWNDANGNGIQDAGEAGVEGVVIDLFDSDGNWMRSATTDAAGHYEFCELSPGTYSVAPKPTCRATRTLAGNDRGKDSNEIPTHVNLVDNDLTIDFGILCSSTPPGECAKCEGKVNSLTLRYTGAAGALVRVTQKKYKGDVYNDFVNSGGEFTIAGHDKKGTFDTEIQLYVNNLLRTKIHTSCSKPIGPGMQFGDFLVVAGSSLKGGALCPAPPSEQGGLCDNGRPRALVLEYTGEDCSASNNQQAAGKVVCSGDPAGASPVRIVITDSATEGTGRVWFDGTVTVGGSLTMDSQTAGTTRLATNSYAYVYSNGTLVQKIQFHTSCSQPLRVGDQYGSLLITGFIAAEKAVALDDR